MSAFPAAKTAITAAGRGQGKEAVAVEEGVGRGHESAEVDAADLDPDPGETGNGVAGRGRETEAAGRGRETGKRAVDRGADPARGGENVAEIAARTTDSKSRKRSPTTTDTTECKLSRKSRRKWTTGSPTSTIIITEIRFCVAAIDFNFFSVSTFRWGFGEEIKSYVKN